MSNRPALQWEGCDAAELAEQWGAGEVRLFERVGSTNEVARRIGLGRGEASVVVLADEQRAGRGRVGRSWHSPAGIGLWVSVLVPPVAPEVAMHLPLRVALAVARQLDAFLPTGDVAVKWPNDLWIEGRKLGGILCEAAWLGSKPGPMVVGVGLNLLHNLEDFPPELRDSATSLVIASGRAASRLRVADAVVPAVLHTAMNSEPLDPVEFARRDPLHGRHVIVHEPGTQQEIARGVEDGVELDGALRLQTEQGMQLIRHGTVRLID